MVRQLVSSNATKIIAAIPHQVVNGTTTHHISNATTPIAHQLANSTMGIIPKATSLTDPLSLMDQVTSAIHHVIIPAVTAVIIAPPVVTPETAPIGIQILIYMAMYQYYLLALILPTVYLVIVRLFGFPLLQRWKQEVAIILYPTRAKFVKIDNEYQEFFSFKEGAYWRASPISPIPYEEEIPVMRNGKQVILKGGTPRMRLNVTLPENTIHVYTHGVNQAAYDMVRRETKPDELMNTNHKVRPAKSHGIWIMKNFFKHFHKHWVIIIGPNADVYQLIPVKERQHFTLGLFHSLGIQMQKVVENTEVQVEGDVENESTSGQKVVLERITSQTIISKIKHVSENHNFSANTAYRLLKKMNKVERNFVMWITGAFDMRLIVVLAGAAIAVVLVLVMMHGGPSLGPPPK